MLGQYDKFYIKDRSKYIAKFYGDKEKILIMILKYIIFIIFITLVFLLIFYLTKKEFSNYTINIEEFLNLLKKVVVIYTR